MIEYRVVATQDTEDLWSGKKYHRDAANCWWNGVSHRLQTFDKKAAKEYLKLAKEACLKFDKETQARTDRNATRYWQTNIRIQIREVTEWK